jgi:hypothetical protein
MFGESTNWGPIGKIRARFWLPFGRLSVLEKSAADLENRGPISRAGFFLETYFWARFVPILWEILLL